MHNVAARANVNLTEFASITEARWKDLLRNPLVKKHTSWTDTTEIPLNFSEETLVANFAQSMLHVAKANQESSELMQTKGEIEALRIQSTEADSLDKVVC